MPTRANFYRYCPVCQKECKGDTAEKADLVLTLHIKFSHPEYYE